MKKIALIVVLAGFVFGVMTGCNDTADSTPPSVDATVNFVVLAAGFPGTAVETIDFSPNAALPAGVTYILTDDKGHNWKSADGFNGQVTAGVAHSSGGNVTFTQTFYLQGTKITSAASERTVEVIVATLGGVKFAALVSDSGSVTLKHP